MCLLGAGSKLHTIGDVLQPPQLSMMPCIWLANAQLLRVYTTVKLINKLCLYI